MVWGVWYDNEMDGYVGGLEENPRMNYAHTWI